MFVHYLLLVIPAAILGLEIEPEQLMEYQSMFYEGIRQHIQGEYSVLMPLVARQNESWQMCKETMISQRPTCRSCVEVECGMEHGDLVHEHLQGYMFNLPAEASVNWDDWHQIGANVFDNVIPDMETYGGYPAVDTMPYGEVPDKKALPLAFAALPAALPAFSTVQAALPWGMAGFTLGTKLAENWDGFTNVMGDIGNGFGDVFNGIGNGLGDAFNGIGNGIGDVGNFIGGLFGRRRLNSRFGRRRRGVRMSPFNNNRMHILGEDTRQCMEQCSECMPFLGEVKDFVSGACGEGIMEDQRNMAMMIKELKVLYRINGLPGQPRRSSPILKKIEYNPENFKLSSMSYGDVYITAMTPSGPVRYPSEYRFRMQWPQVSILEFVEELVEKWGL